MTKPRKEICKKSTGCFVSGAKPQFIGGGINPTPHVYMIPLLNMGRIQKPKSTKLKGGGKKKKRSKPTNPATTSRPKTKKNKKSKKKRSSKK